MVRHLHFINFKSLRISIFGRQLDQPYNSFIAGLCTILGFKICLNYPLGQLVRVDESWRGGGGMSSRHSVLKIVLHRRFGWKCNTWLVIKKLNQLVQYHFLSSGEISYNNTNNNISNYFFYLYKNTNWTPILWHFSKFEKRFSSRIL